MSTLEDITMPMNFDIPLALEDLALLELSWSDNDDMYELLNIDSIFKH